MPYEISRVESRFSQATASIPIETPTGAKESVSITWDMIDKSTANYAKILHEYDLAEVIKLFVKTYKKTGEISVLPKPGNIGLDDTMLGFREFYKELESTVAEYRRKRDPVLSPEHLEALRAKCRPLVEYITSGVHESKDLVFSGWKRSFAAAKRNHKQLLLGVISVDIPVQGSGAGEYKCSGSQHYISFGYDIPNERLYLFDSAAKVPHKEHSEVYYILKFAFEALVKKPVHTKGLVFKHVLQPGAGDRHEEHEHSYNNQNVFCHTWALWFAFVMIIAYKPSEPQASLKYITGLAHKNQLLNLAMIKRFASWLMRTIQPPEDPNVTREAAFKKFATRAFERAKSKGDEKRLQEVLEIYTMTHSPLIGLDYIYNYKNETIVPIQDLITAKKVKLDSVALHETAKTTVASQVKTEKSVPQASRKSSRLAKA